MNLYSEIEDNFSDNRPRTTRVRLRKPKFPASKKVTRLNFTKLKNPGIRTKFTEQTKLSMAQLAEREINWSNLNRTLNRCAVEV